MRVVTIEPPVHHSVIVELTLRSYRLQKAKEAMSASGSGIREGFSRNTEEASE